MTIYKLNDAINVEKVISDVIVEKIKNEEQICRLLVITKTTTWVIDMKIVSLFLKTELHCDDFYVENFLRIFSQQLNLDMQGTNEIKFVNYFHLYGYVIQRLLIYTRQKFPLVISESFSKSIYTKNCFIGEFKVLD